MNLGRNNRSSCLFINWFPFRNTNQKEIWICLLILISSAHLSASLFCLITSTIAILLCASLIFNVYSLYATILIELYYISRKTRHKLLEICFYFKHTPSDKNVFFYNARSQSSKNRTIAYFRNKEKQAILFNSCRHRILQ